MSLRPGDRNCESGSLSRGRGSKLKSVRAGGNSALSTPITVTGWRWDPTAALAYVGGDRQLLSELLAIFVADGPAHVEALRDAITRADVAELTRLAHLLKGQLRALGSLTAASLAERLEESGYGGDLDGTLMLFAPLEHELSVLRERVVREEWR